MRTLARRRDREEILHRLRRLQPGSPRRWGRMTPHQMICHLTDSLRLAAGRIPVSPGRGLLRRTLLKWAVLYAPLPWPAGIRTCAELDQDQAGTRPTEFSADFAQLEVLLEDVPSRPNELDRRPHPLFGRMSAAAWLRWGYRHLDHHLRQFGA